MISILFGALVSLLVQGTVVQPDCKARNFEPKACKVSKALHDAGQLGK